MIRYIQKFSGVLLFIGSVFAITVLTSQNVGINTITPQEELDVDGNIGVTGAIKPNGQTGTEGQVLQMNAGGGMAWVDMSKWENIQEYTQSGTWKVPAGVTKVMFELWAGGGAGGAGGGGGSGAYVFGFFNVTPGATMGINVGIGGITTTTTTTGSAATNSYISNGSASVHAKAGTNAGTNTVGSGGTGVIATTYGLIKYFSIDGQSGQPTRISYGSVGTNTNDYRKIHDYGNGGSSPLRPQSGGIGGVRVNGNLSGAWSLSNYTLPTSGRSPGGGGGGYQTSTVARGGGGAGQVIIYW